MDDLIKNAVKTKNITNKNKMPDYMLKERIVEFWLVLISVLWLEFTEATDRTILSEIQAGINKGNINTDSGLKMGAIDVSHEGRHESLLADFEKRQKARKIAVSTDDKEVKATLRLVFVMVEHITLLCRKRFSNYLKCNC